MQEELHVLPSTATLDDALHVMCLTDVRRIGILEEGRFIGVLTQRDLLGVQSVLLSCTRRAAKSGYATSKKLRQVFSLGSVVNRNVPKVRVETSVAEAAELLLYRKVEQLAVLTDDGVLVGFVTERDFVKWSIAGRKPTMRFQR